MAKPMRYKNCHRGMILLATILVVTNIWAENLPVSPENPTKEHCDYLSRQLHQRLSHLHQESLHCVRGKPQFSRNAPKTCNNGTYTAYAQCVPIWEKICRTQKHRDREVDKCRSKIPNAEISWESKRVNSIYSDAQDSISFISDPKAFLSEALNPFPKAKDLIFTGPEAKFNRSRAEDLLKYVQDFATGGLKAVPKNPIIGSIQEEVFRYVFSFQKQNLDRINQITDQIYNFEVAPNLPPNYTPPQATPTRINSEYGGQSYDDPLINKDSDSYARQREEELAKQAEQDRLADDAVRRSQQQYYQQVEQQKQTATSNLETHYQQNDSYTLGEPDMSNIPKGNPERCSLTRQKIASDRHGLSQLHLEHQSHREMKEILDQSIRINQQYLDSQCQGM